MKPQEQHRTMTKRDLVNKIGKLEKALGEQSQRADAAERESARLRGEFIRLRAEREGKP